MTARCTVWYIRRVNTAPTSDNPDRRVDALVVLVAAALFARTFGFGFTDWDDLDFIVRNPLVADPLAMGWQALLTTPWLGYPQTVPVLSWHLDSLVGGGAAWPFHVTNVVLHAFVTWLVLAIGRSYGLGRLGAGAAALLFAVHPLVVEPVAWATGRKDLLAAAAILTAFAVHRRAVSAERDATGRELAAIGIATVLGVLSKPLLVVLPVLLGADLAIARRRPGPRQWACIAGTAIAGIAVTLIAMRQQESVGVLRELTLGERVLYATQHAALQLEHTFVPLNLLPKYLDPMPMPLGTTTAILAIAMCVLLAAVAAMAWRRGATIVAFGLVWWCVAFAPSSGLVPLTRGPADVYSYVPLVGLALAAGAGIRAMASTRVAISLVAALTLGFGALTWVQTAIWERPVTLWGALVDARPDDRRAWWAFADAWRAEGRIGHAVGVYETAFERLGWPEDPDLLYSLATGCHAVGDLPCTQRMLEAIGHRYPMTPRFAFRYVGFVDHDLGGPSDHRFDRALYPEAEQRTREALIVLSGDLDAIEAFATEHLDADPMWIPAAQRFSTEHPTRPAAAALLERAGLPVPPLPARRP